jgi:DNA primase
MDISEAKKISIVDYLENMGYTHAKIRRGQYWYRSPLREEKTPSFVVNNNLHEWYDW